MCEGERVLECEGMRVRVRVCMPARVCVGVDVCVSLHQIEH